MEESVIKRALLKREFRGAVRQGETMRHPPGRVRQADGFLFAKLESAPWRLPTGFPDRRRQK
jgi:hypothetical protein